MRSLGICLQEPILRIFLLNTCYPSKLTVLRSQAIFFCKEYILTLNSNGELNSGGLFNARLAPLTKNSHAISHKKIMSYVNCFNSIYGMKNFICECSIYEIEVSCTMISHAKFWNNLFNLWIRHFICGNFLISYVRWKFHMGKCSNSMCFSHVKWHVKISSMANQGLPVNLPFLVSLILIEKSSSDIAA